MRKWTGILLGLAAVVALAETATEETAMEYPYKGSRRCKACHARKDMGNQYGKWREGPHSKAYEVLESEESTKAAKEKGIDDPQSSDDCLKCHTTTYDVDAKWLRGLKKSEGISCESCHGPAGHYWKSQIMKDPERAKEMGLKLPKNEEHCQTCHNDECPFFESFDFEKSLETIKHWGVLKKRRAE